MTGQKGERKAGKNLFLAFTQSRVVKEESSIAGRTRKGFYKISLTLTVGVLRVPSGGGGKKFAGTKKKGTLTGNLSSNTGEGGKQGEKGVK